jgi:hypothetical protein
MTAKVYHYIPLKISRLRRVSNMSASGQPRGIDVLIETIRELLGIDVVYLFCGFNLRGEKE